MARFFVGLFIILHGLVHLWFVVLSLKLVEFRPEMGWTSRSWIFTPLFGDSFTRQLAAVLYGLAALALVAAGAGAFTRGAWTLPVLLGAGAFSAIVVLLFWDGRLEQLVVKGLLGLLISLFLVGGAASARRYQREIQVFQDRLASQDSQVIETACGPIEYARVGEGVPVLVVHGNAGGFDQGLGLAEGFLSSDFQVIAPSRFGYLRSPLPEGASVEIQADAYACLLDSLGISQAAVFASSAGVTSAVQFALRYPERVTALVFHSPNAPGEVGLTPPPQGIFRVMMGSDYLYWALTTYLRPQMQNFVGVPKGFALTPEMQTYVDGALQGGLPISARTEGMVFDTFVSNPAINDCPLEQVAAPTLVVSAVDDPMALHASARTLAERIPNARLLPVPDGGHLLLGHTAEVQEEVTEFLHTQVAELAHQQP